MGVALGVVWVALMDMLNSRLMICNHRTRKTILSWDGLSAYIFKYIAIKAICFTFRHVTVGLRFYLLRFLISVWNGNLTVMHINSFYDILILKTVKTLLTDTSQQWTFTWEPTTNLLRIANISNRQKTFQRPKVLSRYI